MIDDYVKRNYPENYVAFLSEEGEVSFIDSNQRDKTQCAFERIKEHFIIQADSKIEKNRKKFWLSKSIISGSQERAVKNLMQKLAGKERLTFGEFKEVLNEYARVEFSRLFSEMPLMKKLGIYPDFLTELSDTVVEICQAELSNCQSCKEVDCLIEDMTKRISQPILRFLEKKEKTILKEFLDTGPLTRERILIVCDELLEKYPNFMLLKHMKAKSENWQAGSYPEDSNYYSVMIDIFLYSKYEAIGRLNSKAFINSQELLDDFGTFLVEMNSGLYEAGYFLKLNQDQFKEISKNILKSIRSDSVQGMLGAMKKTDTAALIATSLYEDELKITSGDYSTPLQLIELSDESLKQHPESLIWKMIRAKARIRKGEQIKTECRETQIEIYKVWLNMALNYGAPYIKEMLDTFPEMATSLEVAKQHVLVHKVVRQWLWANEEATNVLGLTTEQWRQMNQELVQAYVPNYEELSIDDIRGEATRFKPMKTISHFLSGIYDHILKQMKDDVLQDPEKLEGELRAQLLENPKHVVIQALHSQAVLWKAITLHKNIKEIPFENLWRFAIDGEFEEDGPFILENEPGYLQGWLSGLAWSINNTFGDRINASWYIELHDHIVKNVNTFEEIGNLLVRIAPMSIGLRQEPVSFNILNLDQDPLGLEDLRGEMAGSVKRLCRFDGEINSLSDISTAELREWMKGCFFLYIQRVKKAQKPAERLLAAIWLMREMEINHVFSDGNGRSSVAGLIGILANDPGLPIPMFNNPNVLDVNGPEKLSYRVLEAMINYRHAGLYKSVGKCKNPLFLRDMKDLPKDIEELRNDLLSLVEGRPWSDIHDWMQG